MPVHVSCDLCGADNARPVFDLRDYRFQVDDHVWRVVQCRRCGLGYLNPRPTAEEIGRYYPPTYYEQREGLGERYVRQAANIGLGGGELLEIGAERGDLLQQLLRSFGWRVSGIEPWAGERVDDPDILAAPFPNGLDLPAGSFDVIAAWSVFEHLHHPAAAFARCAELLRPSGRLVIQVPNFASIQSRLARREDVPRHLYFFTAATLRAYARRSGLVLRDVKYPTNLGPAGGEGALRLPLTLALGGTVDDFFSFYRLPSRQRFAQKPRLAGLWAAAAGAERLLLNATLLSRLRLSGQIVATFHREAELPSATGFPYG